MTNGEALRIFGISYSGYTRKDIDKRYKELAHMWHPDVCKLPEAERKFKEINIAYEVLRKGISERAAPPHFDSSEPEWNEYVRKAFADILKKNGFGPNSFGKADFNYAYNKVPNPDSKMYTEPDETDPNLSVLKFTHEWNGILDDIIAGFEAARRIQDLSNWEQKKTIIQIEIDGSVVSPSQIVEILEKNGIKIKNFTFTQYNE